MKVFFLNKILPKTGVSTHQITLCKRLLDLGVEPIFITGNVDKDIEERINDIGIKIHRLPFPSGMGKKQNILYQLFLYLISIPLYLFFFVKHRPSVVHVHWPVTSYLAAMSRRIFDIPFVVTHHIAGIEDNILRRKGNMVIATCLDLKKELKYKFKYDEDAIRLVYNGIDFEHFSTFSNSHDVDGDFTVCHVGSINERKGIDILVKAYKLLDIKEKRLILQGHGNEKFINDLVSDNKIVSSDNIEFVGFQDTRVTFGKSHCFVLASVKEGFVLTPLEAMAFGIPVIRSRCEGYSEQIDEGINGLTFDVNDITGLKNALVKVYSDLNLRTTMIESGKKKVKMNFTDKIMTNKTLDVYKEVINK
ncbi:glycosyltransferase family 4 protein [Vibrio breoganii]